MDGSGYFMSVGGLLVALVFKKNIEYRLLLATLQIGIGIYLLFSLYQRGPISLGVTI